MMSGTPSWIRRFLLLGLFHTVLVGLSLGWSLHQVQRGIQQGATTFEHEGSRDLRIAHGAFWVLGLLAMAVWFRREARQQEALRESEQRYRIVASYTSDWEYWIGPTGEVIYMSPSCLEVTGYPPEAFLQNPGLLAALVHPDDRAVYVTHHEIACTRRGSDQVSETRFRIQTNGCEVRWIHHRCRSVFGEDGTWLGIRSNNRDITELRNAEEARFTLEREQLHSQRLESLGVLAGGIAHDFNNLLGVMLGNLELLGLELPPVPQSRTYLERTLKAVRQATTLVHQMLDFSGHGAFQMAPLNLNALVQENMDLLKVSLSKRHVFQLDLAPELPYVQADAGQMQQVIMNLITNASEAKVEVGDGGGTVTLCTAVVVADEALLAQSRLDKKPEPGRFVQLQVSDTGCGMDEVTQARLFEPFFTTKFTGRGLGMAAVHGILRGHHGALLVDSALGRGSTIRVLLPALEQVCVTAGGSYADMAPPAKSQPLRILVVDDEDLLREAVCTMLALMGHEAVPVASGEEALRRYDEQSAAINLVLLDLTMPGLGGAATLELLKQRNPALPIILSSGYSEQEAHHQQHKLLRRFAHIFLSKPYNLIDLKIALTKAFQAEAGGDDGHGPPGLTRVTDASGAG